VSLVFPFDPNIERASTVPARVYNDPVFLELERERIFARTWQLVGRTDEVREHGQFFTAQVGNDPIVVLRDGETVRGFYNVCLHRAGPVAQGCGKRNTLQCRYHGWTYSLDGTLKRAPEMEGVQRFSPDEMHLVPVQVATWGALVFVNVDGKAPPLLDVLEDLPGRLAPFHCESMQWVMRKEWEIACNWKIYVDNYLEGYHVPVVHPGLHKELDYDNYIVAPRRRPGRAGCPRRSSHPRRPRCRTIRRATGAAGCSAPALRPRRRSPSRQELVQQRMEMVDAVLALRRVPAAVVHA
jgi:choline monooxygenase